MFTIFPELAPELRVKIWKLALPLHTKALVEIESGRYSTRRVQIIFESDISASLLQTSSESRAVVLENLPNCLPSANGSNVYRYHPERTTVHVLSYWAICYEIKMMLPNRSELAYSDNLSYKFEGIQRVELSSDCILTCITPMTIWSQAFFKMFPDLKIIVIVRGIFETRKVWKEMVEVWYKDFMKSFIVSKLLKGMEHQIPKLEYQEQAL